MFHSTRLNDNVNRIHERALTMTYDGKQGRSSEFFVRWLVVFKNVGHHSWPTEKILGCGTARTVNSGPFSMRFHVFLSFLVAELFSLPYLLIAT